MKKKKVSEKTYRLFGCRFVEEDFNYINNELEKINEKRELSNSTILLELFKMYYEENKSKKKRTHIVQ
ncbi:hypothetical protein [Fusobacterium sp.]|uniref:hypothetical protein n=1 Tax=Fusobacterium sp. TaxID=68766 RepID=UPI0029037734|nr:hypothetical protein [Fusobacterium sp.]MDU1910194.1 hypothetical protein [Fusobacterium sp.]